MLEYFPILIFISSSKFMYEPRFFAPTPLDMACCKLFTAALAAAIEGDDSSHDKGPVGLGRSQSGVLKYLKIDILKVERDRELETAVSTRVVAHVLKFLYVNKKFNVSKFTVGANI